MAPARESHRLFLAIGSMARQTSRDFHDATGFKVDPFQSAQSGVAVLGATIDNRKIGAVHGVLFELSCQALVGEVRFCDDKQPRGVFINAVHNTGAAYPSDALDIGAMCKKRVYQRP